MEKTDQKKKREGGGNSLGGFEKEIRKEIALGGRAEKERLKQFEKPFGSERQKGNTEEK